MKGRSRSCYSCEDVFEITTCSLPPRDKERDTCKAYFPKIPPIKAVRLPEATVAMRGCDRWTNLTYHCMLQGGLRYYGVDKLIPYGPPPSSPVLCRPAPLKPINTSSMIVYSSP